MKIVTHNVCPPIPSRSFDWSATLDNYEPGDYVGKGPTKGSAVWDLLQNITPEAFDELMDELITEK